MLPISPIQKMLIRYRRIAEIQSELEELKNTVKQHSETMLSNSPSEHSDRRPSMLAPEMTQNGAYSPGSSSYPNPFSQHDDSFRPVGITGRIDSTTEDDLFLTYSP